MLRACRAALTCLLCLVALAVTIATFGCKETGETVRDMGTKFNQGLTEKDRTAITKVNGKISSLREQLKAETEAQLKADRVSAQVMDTMNSGLGEIDVSTCPDDFRQQFYKYKADFGVATNDFEEFVTYSRDHHDDWFGDPKAEMNRLRHRFEQAVNQADSDVTELYAIAHKYGG